MFDVLNKFQTDARLFDPITLVVTGAVCVFIGIALWLGGMKFTRIIAAAVGFAGGATAAFYIFPENQTFAAITGAFIGAIIGIILHQFIALIAGTAVFAIAVFVFLVGNHFSDKVTDTNRYQEPSVVSVKLSPIQTVKQISFHTAGIVNNLFNLSMRLPAKTWPAAAAALVALALLAALFWRLVLALACSSLGTAMIFCGMFCLLLYKGSAPLTRVYNQLSFFSGVFAAMVVAGIVSQLILCKPHKLKILEEQKEIDKKNKHNNSGDHKWTAQRS